MPFRTPVPDMLKLFYVLIEFDHGDFGRILTTAHNELEAHQNVIDVISINYPNAPFLMQSVRFVCLTDKPFFLKL